MDMDQVLQLTIILANRKFRVQCEKAEALQYQDKHRGTDIVPYTLLYE